MTYELQERVQEWCHKVQIQIIYLQNDGLSNHCKIIFELCHNLTIVDVAQAHQQQDRHCQDLNILQQRLLSTI